MKRCLQQVVKGSKSLRQKRAPPPGHGGLGWLCLGVILILCLATSSRPQQVSKTHLLGEDEASRSPHHLEELLANKVLRYDTTSRPTALPTFLPHKYGGKYTQEQISNAAGWTSGRYNPEEYEAILLDQKLRELGGKFPFETPNAQVECIPTCSSICESSGG